MLHLLILTISTLAIPTSSIYHPFPISFPHTLLNLHPRYPDLSPPTVNSTIDIPPPVGTCTWLPSSPLQTCFPWPQGSGANDSSPTMPTSGIATDLISSFLPTATGGVGADPTPLSSLSPSGYESLSTSMVPVPTSVIGSGVESAAGVGISITRVGSACSTSASSSLQATPAPSTSAAGTLATQPPATTAAPAPPSSVTTHPRCRKKA